MNLEPFLKIISLNFVFLWVFVVAFCFFLIYRMHWRGRNYSRGSFVWSNHQIETRRISKRKEPNLLYTRVWEPTNMRGSEAPHAQEVGDRKGTGHSELRMR